MSTKSSKQHYQLPSPIPSPPRSFSPTHHNHHIHMDSSCQSTQQSPPRSPSTSRLSTKHTKEWTIYLLTAIQNNLSLLDGRDKGMKIVQYAIKILLHYRRVGAKRWTPLVSHLSQTRKILRLGNWIGKVKEMMTLYNDPPSSTKKQSYHITRWCTLFIVLGNRLADDLFCFYKMGMLGPWIGKKAERVAIYCWFIGIWIDLKSNIISLSALYQQTYTLIDEQQNHHQEKLFSSKLSCAKLSMDAIFCACDIWKPTYSPGVQAWSGFFSGCLAGYKMWCTN